MKKTTKRIIAAVVALFYVVGIGMAIDAVMTSRTAPGAIAWAASLVTVPVVAVPAYAIFGRSKFEGQLEAYLARKHEIDELIVDSRANLEPFTVGDEGEYPEYDAIRSVVETNALSGSRPWRHSI
jgi:cardiolipin synthase